MKDLIKRVEDIISNNDHYLVKGYITKHPYFEEFLKVGNILKPVLSNSEFEYWAKEKMLLKSQLFIDKTFIQGAVETSVARFFCERFPKDFRVEAKINPENKKDVDCQFKDKEFTFNIEVKCSDFKIKEEIDEVDAFKYETVGRLPDRGREAIDTISAAINEGLGKRGETEKPHLVARKMDNNLREFLVLAHEKFNSTPNENELNILLVGCDDDRDIQNWMNYLWADQGLFTEESFYDRLKYNNVDLVVFTNQYFKHNRYFDKSSSDHWTLENGFNLIFGNPFRKITKENAIRHFFKILPNFTEKLSTYIVPGEAPDYVKKSVLISWFVKDYLEKGKNIFVFEANKAT